MASLNDFLSTLRGAPATGQQLSRDEAKLIAERERVSKARVHIDDFVAKALDGTRKRASDAIARLLAHHLNADSVAATHPDSLENEAITFDLLALTPSKPSPANSGDPKGTASVFPQGAAPDSGILTFLLLDQTEKAVEKLVRDNLSEACAGGIRLSERRKKLADIDSKLAAIRAQRAALVEGLREAARHVKGTPEYIEKGPSDADVAREAAAFARDTGEVPAGI